MIVLHPFASKTLPTGEKLYRRKHGYVFSQAVGVSTHKVTVPYANCKINEVEIIGCPPGCTVNLKVFDSTTGTYTTVPNYMLNQFGFNVNIGESNFKDISQYDADVFYGMQICLEVTSPSAFSMGVNIVFHEVRS